jgi:hypothetical protein
MTTERAAPALSSRALRGGGRTVWIAGGALALFARVVVLALRPK